MKTQLKKILIPLLLLPFTLFAAIQEVGFEESMGNSFQKQYELLFQEARGRNDFEFFRALYERNKPSLMQAEAEPRIPKIIHQIWIGPNPVPEMYKRYQQSWIRLHPDWEYWLWTDKEVESCQWENLDLIQNARSYAEKADILRYEILDRIGGLYVDIDCLCLQNFDELHHKYDFYSGLIPPHRIGRPIVANGLIASKPHNPLFKTVLAKIRNHWEEIENQFDRGELGFDGHPNALAVKRTMFPLTDAICETVSLESRAIVFPSTYFYPVFWELFPLEHSFWERYVSWALQEDVRPFRKIRSESLAAHDFRKEGLSESLVEVDFNSAMGGRGLRSFSELKKNPVEKQKLAIFRRLYNENKPSQIALHGAPTIPKIIHQIWLNSEPMPEAYQEATETWISLHPGWEYRLWTSKQIEALQFPEKDLYLKANSKEQKERLMRYVLLSRFGGLYVDMGMRCLKSIDDLHHYYSFYCGLEPPLNSIVVGEAIIASKPGHLILKKTCEAFRHDGLASSVLTDQVYRYCNLDGKAIVFPATYFYPVVGAGIPLHEKGIKGVLNYFKREPERCFYDIQRESFTRQDLIEQLQEWPMDTSISKE